MRIQTTGAFTTILGSLLFIVAAFMPISMAVFPKADAAQKEATIAASLTQWHISQILFGLGSLIAALGVAMVAFAVRDKPFVLPLLLAVMGLTVGAILWSRYVYLRAVDPQRFAAGTIPGWYFVIYTLLTFASIPLISIALFNMGLPTWVGWLLLIVPVILFVLYLIFRDMPPFVHYVLLLIAGIAITRLS